MSGSPIIQDGKLIGAVTHVFVQDSSKGYGIFIENMLDCIEGNAADIKGKSIWELAQRYRLLFLMDDIRRKPNTEESKAFQGGLGGAGGTWKNKEAWQA